MNIAIWGTGIFGRYIWEILREREGLNIKYFVDSKEELWGTNIYNIPIVSPEQFHERLLEQLDFVVVAFTDCLRQKNSVAKREGIKFGFVRNRVLWEELPLADNLRKDRNIICLDENVPCLAKIETNVVDYCNLNCRACSHFSNLFEKGEQVSFETFCRDLVQISNNVYFGQIDLLGGEALLSDRITDYLNFSRKLLPDADIGLVTNGLLLPGQTEDFFKCCVKNDILVAISGYPPTIRIKESIIKVLERYGVRYSFRGDVKDFGRNISLDGNEDKDISVRNCREYRCHFFRNGRLYKCPFEALGNKLFTYFGVDIQLNGGIDIYDEDLNWNLVTEQLENNPVDACRYCGKEERVAWACNEMPTLEDWII